MGILTRYLIRAHAGPFLFAFTALTGLLFLNAVAQRMESLVGKGLPWSVIAEFLLLSLPHTVALTLPMAILVAVLYTFSELTAANEITAMSAGGIKPARMLTPLLGVGVILAGIMFFFNDQVLPATNHRLKNLIIDIQKKTPTFELREQVVNRVLAQTRTGIVYLTASGIDPVTNELTEVAIYDLSDPYQHRTTYAESGKMEFNAERTDLYLTLHDGEVREVGTDRSGKFNRSAFETQIVPLRGVGDELERQQGGTIRSDREMSIAMLREEVADRAAEIEQVRESHFERARMALDQALGRAPEGAPRPYQIGPPQGARRDDDSGAGEEFLYSEDDMTRRLALAGRQHHSQIQALETNIDEFWVEIHKKFAIAFACIVFVLIGAPLAIRFPRGGVGMVIAVSVGIFAIYWAGLIGGENLADKGLVPPFWAMWTPDLAFLVLGVFLAVRMGRAGSANRGGSLDEAMFVAREFARRLLKRPRAAA